MSLTAIRPTVTDLMKAPVLHVSADAPLRDVVRVLCHRGVSGVPVVDEAGMAVGVVTVSDLMWLAEELLAGNPAGGRGAADMGLARTAGEVMTPDVFGVPPTASLEELASFFSRTGLHRALVLEDRRVVGVVSATDVLDLLGREPPCEPARGPRREPPAASTVMPAHVGYPPPALWQRRRARWRAAATGAR